MLNDYMTTTEAAKYLKRTPEYICYLCSKGKLLGAKRIGKRMWIIPRKSVEEYKPGLQGFAAKKAKEEQKKASRLAEINAAIREGIAKKMAANLAIA